MFLLFGWTDSLCSGSGLDLSHVFVKPILLVIFWLYSDNVFYILINEVQMKEEESKRKKKDEK